MKKTYGAYRDGENRFPVLPDFIRHGGLATKRGADLNTILGRVLSETGDLRTSVIRCDELPVVQGDEEDLTRTFLYVLDFILSCPPAENTLFLHIKCEIARTDYIDLSFDTTHKMYTITFHSNSEAEGRDFPHEQKKYCMNCLSGIKGQFNVNTEPGTGWLFTLEVPGKLK